MPGWAKPVGKPARATFTLTTKPQSAHVEDLVIEGAGGGVKGTLDFDGGDLQSANFSSYGFSDGDKATLKAERGQDGTLRVTMRGDVYDARGFVKTTTSSLSDQNTKSQMMDIDLDIKLGAIVGFNGEALRSLDLKLSRRAGQIRTFGMNAKIGAIALVGDLRGRGGRQVIYLETNDAGSLFRFSDIYSRMIGGQMWVAMDPPAPGSPRGMGSSTSVISQCAAKLSSNMRWRGRRTRPPMASNFRACGSSSRAVLARSRCATA